MFLMVLPGHIRQVGMYLEGDQDLDLDREHWTAAG